ncbi:hypothetical protein VTG60DRAFT_2154 [Thermothelomyces hinnuleus]
MVYSLHRLHRSPPALHSAPYVCRFPPSHFFLPNRVFCSSSLPTNTKPKTHSPQDIHCRFSRPNQHPLLPGRLRRPRRLPQQPALLPRRRVPRGPGRRRFWRLLVRHLGRLGRPDVHRGRPGQAGGRRVVAVRGGKRSRHGADRLGYCFTPLRRLHRHASRTMDNAAVGQGGEGPGGGWEGTGKKGPPMMT